VGPKPPRIALDTNVLVRFLIEDDEKQSAAAARLIGKAIAADELLFVSDVVLCETVWVLSSAYQVAKSEIVSTLRALSRTTHVAFRRRDDLVRALDAWAGGSGDFADYLIRENAFEAGCEVVATFDKALLRETGFRAP
jgi:predicted nucleic-acid-binding protein